MKATVIMSFMLVAAAGHARAQLISPGKLSSAHAELEGMRSCTSCHELRKPGISPTRCLSCHEPLQSRIAAGRGYHARLANDECGECHKEHFGREFDVLRLDTASFDHTRTGYRLEGAHTTTGCRECHTATNIAAADVRAWATRHDAGAKTLLGLPTTCPICHAGDDPHAGQFRTGCDRCHAVTEWGRAERFDHARASYRLTGQHRQASCSGCHTRQLTNGRETVRYRGIDALGCASCHEDAHAGAMGATCTSCHDTDGWTRVDRASVANRFDHARTRFPLRGRHAAADCAACHSTATRTAGIRVRLARSNRSATYPRPAFDSCSACHLDFHEGEFTASAGGVACSGCHTEHGWEPTTFDLERHGRGSRFPLEGAHIATLCTACHGGVTPPERPRFRLADTECTACHREDSPHGERFASRTCAECHEAASFQVSRFDHARAAGESCASCHLADEAHAGQFGDRSCETCHATESWRIERFDHARTRFALDGAHVRVACVQCHKPAVEGGRSVVMYTPLRMECSACHGSVP
jgi:hypothetical protein